MPAADTVRRNLEWFTNSGIMRPADGFWGVGERIVLTAGNAALDTINVNFPSHTTLAPNAQVLEHRRADCNFQTACAFDLGAALLGNADYRKIADNIVDYLVNRSCLRVYDARSPVHGLWGWSIPVGQTRYWTDDNSWVVTLLMYLGRRGRPQLTELGVAAARSLYRHARAFIDHVLREGRHAPYPDNTMKGNWLNPHWMGLVTMAMAHASAADDSLDWAGLSADYHRLVLEGPHGYDRNAPKTTSTGLPWTMSEYAYLALTAAVAAKRFGDETTAACARFAADTLVRFQEPPGHFRAEHWEAPAATHLADLVYTQNWATHGLAHCAEYFQEDRYRRSHRRSLDFLARIQDRSDAPHLRGCWRGLYDTAADSWGGGDCYEGGASSIYSGWTNAPIALAFLFDELGESFFVKA